MDKYWDIIPPRKRVRRVVKINVKELDENPRPLWIKNLKQPKVKKVKADKPTKQWIVPKSDKECLHKQCTSCQGTGTTKFGAPCIHALACSCGNCSPTMLGIDLAKGNDTQVYVDARGVNVTK